MAQRNNEFEEKVNKPKKKGSLLVGGFVIAVPAIILTGFIAVGTSIFSNISMLKKADEFTKNNPEEIMDVNLTASDLSEMGYFKNMMGSQFVDQCRMEVLRSSKELKEDFGKYTTTAQDASKVTECIKRELTELNSRMMMDDDDSFSNLQKKTNSYKV